MNMKLVIVVPCYNEEEVLNETKQRLLCVLDKLKSDGGISEGMVLFVDDGSKDRTWQMIEAFAGDSPMVGGLKLSGNRGHQYALHAGLKWASEHSDASVSIDADLQDDVNAIYEMVNEYHKGNDIVFGVRKERKTDTFFKLAVMKYPESNLFLRGIAASVGYPSTCVYYNRSERFAGESKYPLNKMLAFAIEGITSFSVKPLRLISYLGIIFILVAIGVIIYALYEHFTGNTIEGWTSLLVSMWFIGGSILLACGVTGEYIGKVYLEVKQRPKYFVEKKVNV